jgi:hypothetical protein
LDLVFVEIISSLLLEAMLGGSSSSQALSLLVKVTADGVKLEGRAELLLLLAV